MARTPAVVVRWLVVVVICCCTTTHLLLLLPTAEAIWLNLPSSGTKCVSEEIQNNVVVLADYGVVGDETHSGALPTISASGSRDEGSQRKNQFQSGVVQYNVPWCLHCCFGSAVVALEELLSKEKTDLGFHFIIMFLI
ncbi:hypothetical protein CsSME_00034933 [Camellia sinensis var. sinensis]